MHLLLLPSSHLLHIFSVSWTPTQHTHLVLYTLLGLFLLTVLCLHKTPSITSAHPYLCPPPNSPHETDLPSFPKSWLYSHGFFIATMPLLTPRSSLCPQPSAGGVCSFSPHYHPSHAHTQYTHTHTHTPLLLFAGHLWSLLPHHFMRRPLLHLFPPTDSLHSC